MKRRGTRKKKHTDIFSRVREGEAAFERDTGIKNHTVVLEVVPRTTTTHSGVEGLSGPCRGVPKTRQETVLRVSATRCCKLSAREHLPRTDDHAVAQYYVVVSELPQNGIGGRKRVFNTNVTMLSLIERVMSNLTGVELVHCS